MLESIIGVIKGDTRSLDYSSHVFWRGVEGLLYASYGIG